MRENNLSQLVGALGGWLQARPYGAEQDALDRAARIVLDMRLLGVSIDDVDAPELAALDPEDREVVEQARVWALARREEASRRERADERAALHRRVAEREAGPSDAFAWPASTPDPVIEMSDLAQPEPASHQDEQLVSAGLVETQRSVEVATSTTELADPSDHDFFADPEPAEVPTLSRRVAPDAVFKVVLVVWGFAALGVVAVLVRLALG